MRRFLALLAAANWYTLTIVVVAASEWVKWL
jgi:hypothetical protein